MKVLISADMEGTCGVVSWVQVMPPEVVGNSEASSTVEYERARRRLTAEVNAAIEGAYLAGADEVIVNESHDGMRNLMYDDLDPRCRVITGSDKPLGMMQGVDIEGVGCVFYTGYHAKAGTPGGPLAHTWTGWVNDVRINGRSTGEFGVNAIVGGHFGVPVTLVTGDEKACVQTIDFVGDQCVGVAVKQGISTFAALHVHPLKAQEMIREGASEAVRRAATAKPWVLPADSVIEIEFEHQTRADQAILIPGVTRAGERAVAYRPKDGIEFIEYFRAITKIGSVRMSP